MTTPRFSSSHIVLGRAKAFSPTARSPSPPHVVAIGARVRVLKGSLENRVGVVTELLGKGAARVHFGPMSARVAFVHLEAIVELRDARPIVSTHRAFGAKR